jgi:multiple sugar transport system permease protein
MTRRPKPARRWVHTFVGIVIVAFLLFPLYWMINASFEPPGDILHVPPIWVPVHGTLDGYRAAWDQQWPHLLASLVVAVGTAAITIAVSAPAAYALAKFRLRGGMPIVFAMLLVQMIPGVVVANALYGIFTRGHLFNTYLGLILADAAMVIPFAILIIRAFMTAIPRELQEAARVDGAGHLSIFVRIIVPISRNAIATAAIFAFLAGWGDFLLALTLTNNTNIVPITLSIYQYVGVHTGMWQQLMATSVLASIPAAVVLVAGQRYIAVGFTGSAVKG